MQPPLRELPNEKDKVSWKSAECQPGLGMERRGQLEVSPPDRARCQLTSDGFPLKSDP